MTRFLLAFLLITTILPAYSQGNFQFSTDKSRTVIPFSLINNLIIVPVKVNGVPLNFLLDTGVEETILFSLEQTDEIKFDNVEKIKLRGLGKQESIEGLKSSGNRLEMRDIFDNNHVIFIVLDQNFNFSSHIGIPVNGIIGYQFFRNNVVGIDYDSKKITVYRDAEKIRKKLSKRFTSLPMSIELKKPYLTSTVAQNGTDISAKLLVDTGSSDAVWLFEEKSDSISLPEKFFEDFLGRGFSGEIHGKRGRIDNFVLGGYRFDNPIAAFPDSVSLRHVNMVRNRLGSVGGEILKRFSVVFDYRNERLYLKKGSHYDAPFHYNMSGLEIEHSGLQWVKETVEMNTIDLAVKYDANFNKLSSDFFYKFELQPTYTVTNVRPDSPAAQAGLLKGDLILNINGKNAYRYSLQEISQMLRSEEGRTIKMVVERHGVELKMNFRLVSML